MKNPYETQEQVIADFEQQLEDAKGKLATLKKYKFPIKHKLYIHGCEDSNYSEGKELGLNEDQLETFYRTAYEVEFEGEIEEDGTFYATHVNKVRLPVRIQL